MVAIRYRGKNTIIFPPKYRFAFGITEVVDDDFYELMRSPLFANRVKNGVFEVPADFPLEKPKIEKKEDERVPHVERPSVKQTLKLISSSEDKDFLKGLIEADGRDSIQKEAQIRLDFLNVENK